VTRVGGKGWNSYEIYATMAQQEVMSQSPKDQTLVTGYRLVTVIVEIRNIARTRDGQVR